MEKKLHESRTGIAGNRARLTMRSWRRRQRLDARKATGKHAIAAFDFDGTSIQGNSPVLLVRYLRGDDLLRKRVLAKGGRVGRCLQAASSAKRGMGSRPGVHRVRGAALKSRSTNTCVISTTRLSLARSVFRLKARAAMNARARCGR